MDMYQITRIDPRGRYGHPPGQREVRYGTRRRAAAVARQVREDNTSRIRHGAFTGKPPQLVELIIERAPVGEFTDVTSEFLGEQ